MRTKQGQAFVSLHFNASGSEKLAQISRQHLGKWLIFTIDNQLVGLPRLTEPVTNGTLNLTMNSDQQARQVIAAIFGQ
ncbi:SecDF P1 head subdomain-containing protein [Pseudomonas guariconensis]|uniref:SecDF P1 head subdomain-containing protein n=1 Tax=Pseudomonas guariconensis TaxID=1288410 RepID=UPI0018AA354D|nr:hypothetical protein [Pseudomonas guariconensis]MBF8741409.1 hypothetical protein [Pseudomonas guariconensis]MBF8749007.1 hypothetical protein [Pseudomonas guariconensis]